jgi:hypothetical protein
MMETLPAKVGWLWIKEGFALFRKQPAELSALFFGYMFLMLLIGMLPLLGRLVLLVLIPFFSISFLQASAYVEGGRKVYPNLLWTGFRSPQRNTLLRLGLVYLCGAVIAVLCSALVDGGAFLQAVIGSKAVSEETMRSSNISSAMLVTALLYLLVGMALWYAAPLIAWQKMSLGKAIFFSVYAVRRAVKAFVVFGLIWGVLNVAVPAIVSSVLGALTHSAAAIMFVLLPLSVVLTVIMYCSFYPTYTRVFGDPPDFSASDAA